MTRNGIRGDLARKRLEAALIERIGTDNSLPRTRCRRACYREASEAKE